MHRHTQTPADTRKHTHTDSTAYIDLYCVHTLQATDKPVGLDSMPLCHLKEWFLFWILERACTPKETCP
jgi:hypothetical protein